MYEQFLISICLFRGWDGEGEGVGTLYASWDWGELNFVYLFSL